MDPLFWAGIPLGCTHKETKGELFALQGTLMLPFDLTVLLIMPSIKGELSDRGGYLVWLSAIWSASYWFHVFVLNRGGFQGEKEAFLIHSGQSRKQKT